MQIRNTVSSWGLISILFHWTMAALFFFQFWLGWYMLGIKDMVRQFDLYQWHKSFGFLILLLATLRLIWRLSGRAPKLPASMPASERKLARLSHIFLYLLLFAIPLTGWAVVSTSPLPIATWFFKLFVIPPLPIGISRTSEQTWTSFHALLAYSMLFLAFVHALAALRHHFHHKDDVLLQMLRPGRGSGR